MPRNRTSILCSCLTVLSIVILSFFSTAINAQTGKITAKITDAKSGESLFKASIQIVETKQGALSRDNGVATIINVSPSENYTVVAKYAGYEAFTIGGVKVKSDQTTNLTFKLSSKHQDTIVIAAEKLVDLSKIGIGAKLSSSEIQSIAATQSITDVVALTPGLISDGSNGGYSIHGSRGTQNSERYNGIETTNIVSGGESITQTAVSKFAISEISVATGGLGAEKGNATGGVISSTGRAGASNFELMLRYRQDIPAINGTSSNGYKQSAINDKTYELALGGPISEDMKYFVTAKGNSREFYDAGPNIYTGAGQGLSVLDPSGNNLGQLPNDNYFARSATGSLTFDLLGLHVSADAVLASTNRQFTSWYWSYGDIDEIPAQNKIDNIYSINANTGIGSTGILKVTAGYEASSDRTGKYDHSQGGGLLSLYKLYEATDNFSYDDNTHTVTPGPDGIVDIYTPVSKQIADPRNPSNVLNLTGAGVNPFTGHIEGDGNTFARSTNNPYGLYNFFIAAGNVFGFSNQAVDQISLEGHYNDQFGSHGVALGAEAHIYNINNYSNGLPWDANPFKDSFVVKPIIAGIYVQDKMEFSDITFQPGLRLDVYQPNNDHVLADPYNPLINGKANFTSAPVQVLLSPRLGITYAVSDKTTFNFTYGLYFKNPIFNEVLQSTGGNFASVLARGNNIIGNGGLKGETDEEIDVGFTAGLTDVLRMTINGIYKKMRNISGLARITSPGLALGYYLYTDDEYGNYKGVEFTLDKRMADNFSARFNYTYSTTANTASSATSNYSALVNQSADAEVAVLPLQPFPANWDRTHVAQLLLTLLYGKGEGPKIGSIPLLENFNFSTKTIFQTGNPYTAFNIRGQQTGEHNGQREPSYFQTDGTITRNLPLSDIFGSSMGSSSLDIQFEIYNLFNTTNPLFVYPTSGQGDDDGINSTYQGTTDFVNDPTNADAQQLDALGRLKYNAKWDLNKDNRVSIDEQAQAFKLYRHDVFARRTNYQIPRRFYMNFALHF
ncbi:MAG: TonB-dependent receptor [Ignavibacteriota bacterium]